MLHKIKLRARPVVLQSLFHKRRIVKKILSSYVTARGGQKAEFGLRGGGLRMLFADGSLRTFFVGGGGDIFSSNMPICHYRIHNFAESELNISMICGGGADAESKNDTPSISGNCEVNQNARTHKIIRRGRQISFNK